MRGPSRIWARPEKWTREAIQNRLIKELKRKGIPERKENDRKSKRYWSWRGYCLRRDGYKCQQCGAVANLIVHHKKPVKKRPDLMYHYYNGVTICESCHKKKHPWL